MSARERSYTVRRKIKAPPQIAFDLLSDVPHWSSWARPLVLNAKFKRGAGEVGSVRAAGVWPFLIKEEITASQAPEILSYRYIGRLVPVRNYNATVRFEPGKRGGTQLNWSANFESRLPGPLTKLIARQTVWFLAWRLAGAAKRAARTAA
jgi:hypothetical protein